MPISLPDFPFHVIRSSYGNDSVALIQWAYERKLDRVFVHYGDTGWAKDDWLARVEHLESWVVSLGFRPARSQSIGLRELVRRKKGWPRQGIQFCTEELKIKPGTAWLDTVDPIGMATVLVGVRRVESANRRNFPEYESVSVADGGRGKWAPLVDFTDEERNALLGRAGVEPLPHRSMECFPCINSNRADLRILAQHEDRIAEIEGIETEMGMTSKGKPRTMFRPYRYMGATGIRQIVKWAKSEHGQFNLDDGTGGGSCDGGLCGV